MQETDSELVARARSGNKAAFGELIERHQARAVRVALGMVHNADAAQELVQEAVLQAYLSLDRLRDESQFGSWLYGIVINLCRRYLREQQRRCLSWESLENTPLAAKAGTPDPALVAEQRDQERFVREAVQALSPSNRDATRLFYYEQMSVQEVAVALGISPGAVKVRLHQSRKQLKQRLLPHYPEEIAALSNGGGRRRIVRVTVVHPPGPKDPMASEEQARQYLIQIVASTGGSRDWVHLLEEETSRFLPIYLGPDAHIVHAVLAIARKDESLTGSLMMKLLKAAGSRLKEVRLERLKDEVIHGAVRLSRATKDVSIDARPGEAIALALQCGAPIFAAEEIMDEMSWDVSDPLPVVQRLRQIGDLASLQRAAEEPVIQRVARVFLERGIRHIQDTDGYRRAEVVLDVRGITGFLDWKQVWLIYHYAQGSSGGGNISLPLDALPVVIAHFKRMANMDLAVKDAPQQGRTVIQHQGREYELTVSTVPSEPDEKLTLGLRLKAGSLAD